MRKLVVLFALLLSASAAQAQADKAPAVTRLPGEETLSTRERAERDFLMPIRRKKAAEAPKPTASAEQLASAAPETDATAHFSEASPDPRPEEVAAPAHEATPRSRAARHAAWLAWRRAEARREERAAEARAERRAEARRAARHGSHTSKTSHAKAGKHSSKAKHHTAEKVPHHSKKAASHQKTTAKKTVHHPAAKKTKTKHKSRR